MDAHDALTEIAFWLERDLAPRFKVQAFRRAADAIDGMSSAELRARLDDGRLARTKGIGDSTLKVVRQAVGGDVPDYLADLRAAPRDRPRTAIGDALRGDLHSHTDWSDGTVSLDVMARAATTIGREYQAITDHSPNLTVANGLSAERLLHQLDLVAEWNDAGSSAAGEDGPTRAPASADAGRRARLLTGIEVDILDDGSLDQRADLLDRLDVVVASVHSALRADEITMTRRMLGAVRNPATAVLGHCTGRLVQGSRGTRPPSTFDAKRVFAACAEHQVAVEINARPERQDPPDPLIAMALDAGCLFSIDSDAHAPGHLDFVSLGAARAEAAGVPADRIITTWPLSRLQEWLRDRR
jgi:putative hydrolase